MATAARLEWIGNRFVFEPMGLTAASAKILKFIAQSEKGELLPTEIMRKTGGTKSNVSQRVKFLEKLGYVKRGGCCIFDRRQYPVAITPTGKKKYLEVRKRFQGPVFTLEKHFTKEEVKAHFAFFQKMNAVLDQHTETDMQAIFDN